MDEFNLLDVLERPTEETTDKSTGVDIEIESPALEYIEDDSSAETENLNFDFPDPIEKEIIEPYNAANNIDALLALFGTFNAMAITPLANWKLKKTFGGKDNITALTKSYEKSLLNKDDLTENDKARVIEFQRYLKVKAQLENDIPFSDEELQHIRNVGIPYLEKQQIRIEGGFAFYTLLAGLIGSRIITVATL